MTFSIPRTIPKTCDLTENFMHKKTYAALDLDKTKICRWYKIQVVRHHGILAFGCIEKKFKHTSFMNKFQVSFLSLFYFPSKINFTQIIMRSIHRLRLRVSRQRRQYSCWYVPDLRLAQSALHHSWNNYNQCLMTWKY